MRDELRALPVAYCAPGGAAGAAEILAREGEAVKKITEHPWLKGVPGVWIVDPAAFDLGPPYRIRVAGHAVRRLDIPLEHFHILTAFGGTPETCRVYWGSHGCDHPRGHGPEVPHACDCCECENHPDPDPDNLGSAPSCVASPPYYGPDTTFWGEDAEALGLPLAGRAVTAAGPFPDSRPIADLLAAEPVTVSFPDGASGWRSR